jgi:hypothetical protein
MKNDTLDKLVDRGLIRYYDIQDLDEDGHVGKQSKFRNTQRLILVFYTGQQLVIDSFCSGSAENTVLNIGE